MKETVYGFSRDDSATLALLFDIVIPADEAAGGWDGGVHRLLVEHLDGFKAWSAPALRACVACVDESARRTAGLPFRELTAQQQSAIFSECEAAERAEQPATATAIERITSGKSGLPPFAALLVVAFEGFYGGTSEPAGWGVAGFRPVPAGVEPVDPDPIVGMSPDRVAPHFDVIVVGAGAGGGVAAAELAEAGRHVLLVERSRPHRNQELRGNHLQGKRLAAYDVTAGPGTGSPRVREGGDGSTFLVPGDGDGDAYGLVAMTLGGGTRVWQGMSWRFFPEDFRMALEYGVPGGSTLADWPIGYDDLAPYYDRVENELGVSGDASGPLGHRTPRSGVYFLLGGLLERLEYLTYGIAFVLAFIGMKLVFHAMHVNELPFINDGQPIEWAPEISTWTSLVVILAAMTIATVASVIKAQREAAHRGHTLSEEVPHFTSD